MGILPGHGSQSVGPCPLVRAKVDDLLNNGATVGELRRKVLRRLLHRVGDREGDSLLVHACVQPDLSLKQLRRDACLKGQPADALCTRFQGTRPRGDREPRLDRAASAGNGWRPGAAKDPEIPTKGHWELAGIGQYKDPPSHTLR